MNIRRGFFRLWVVATLVWIAIVLLISWPTAASLYLDERNYVITSEQKLVRLNDSFYWEREKNDNLHRYQVSGNGINATRVFLIAQATFPAEKIAEVISANRPTLDRSAEISEKLAQAWGGTLLGAVAPPLVLLILGSALAWALSGFKRLT